MFLVLVLVLVVVLVLLRLRVRVSAAHLAEHGDDSNEEGVGAPSIRGGEVAGEGADVDESTTFHGGAACNGVGVGAVCRARLSRALSDVQGNGHRCGLELASQLALASRQAARDPQREPQEGDGALVGIQVLVVEFPRVGHDVPVDRGRDPLLVSRTRTLEQVAETLGKAAEETVADTGYWSGAELQEAE